MAAPQHLVLPGSDFAGFKDFAESLAEKFDQFRLESFMRIVSRTETVEVFTGAEVADPAVPVRHHHPHRQRPEDGLLRPASETAELQADQQRSEQREKAAAENEQFRLVTGPERRRRVQKLRIGGKALRFQPHRRHCRPVEKRHC